MTVQFNLVLWEISSTLRKIEFIPSSPDQSNQFRDQDKKKAVEELSSRLEERYFKNADLSVPIYWFITQSTRHILSKMRLVSDLSIASSILLTVVDP